MQPPLVRHVFVYGTLRRGEERDITRLQPAPRWLGLARVPGVLYHLGEYPGVVLGEAGWIQGEVYEVSPELERQLDEIEEVWPQQSGEYCKREIRVQLESGIHLGHGEQGSLSGKALSEITCIVYEIAPERILGKTIIASGDWSQRHAGDKLPAKG